MAGGRILFLISAMVEGGAERVAAMLCSHWVREGREVVLMPTFSGRGECLYQIDPRVRIDYLADRVGTTHKSTLNAVRRLFALRHAIQEIEPDVVVSFLANVNIAALLAGRGTDIPVVVSERSYPPRDKLRGISRFLRCMCYGWAKCVVAPTKDTAEWVTRHCSGSHVAIVPNPIAWPLNDCPPNLAPGSVIPADRKVLLAVGRLSPEKGFDDLLAAFSEVMSRHWQWDLVILGEGRERLQLEALRDALGLRGRVFLPGRVGNMTEWYERADIITLTSHYEGFPNALAEAMAAGVPAVAMDCHTGPSDIVRHGVDGLLIRPESGISGLALGFDTLMRDDLLRQRMGVNARDVQERFSLARIGRLWAEIMGLDS